MRDDLTSRRALLLLCCVIGASCPLIARAQQASDTVAASHTSTVSRQSTDDAWWTGPMLAASPNTLPRGHFLVEPYFYDVRTAHSDGFGSLTFVNYGLTDRFTVGIIPIFGFTMVSEGTNSSGIGLGDLSLLAQYRLTQFRAGSWVPTTAIVVQEALPTGKFDRLGNRPSDGLGGGAYATTLSLYSQTYLWMPNGRILRTRLDLSDTFFNSAHIEDVSVYGTAFGFRGRADPGSSFFVDLAGEYSVTQRWVLGIDLTFRHSANTRVAGYDILDPESVPNPPSIVFNSGSSDGFGFAPGIEYNWTPRFGVLLATRVILAGHNTSSSITPAVAINMFY
jgi:hypothetical protein